MGVPAVVQVDEQTSIHLRVSLSASMCRAWRRRRSGPRCRRPDAGELRRPARVGSKKSKRPPEAVLRWF